MQYREKLDRIIPTPDGVGVVLFGIGGFSS